MAVSSHGSAVFHYSSGRRERDLGGAGSLKGTKETCCHLSRNSPPHVPLMYNLSPTCIKAELHANVLRISYENETT